MTVRDALLASLADAATKHGPEEVAPYCVVWTDKDGLWRAITPSLRSEMSGLLTHGEYDPDNFTGPGIWIRGMLAGVLETQPSPPHVVYLPGVSRQTLRETEDCPRALQPLVELQFRGVLWSHPNGKDWTPAAFLASLGLEVAADEATRLAIQERLPRLLDSDIETLQALGRLDSHKVRNLDSDWPSDILAWMQDPAERNPDWKTFCSACKASYAFDPETDGELAAAEKLAEANGAWNAVWKRFSHSALRYPNVFALLKQVTPPDMFIREEGYPSKNTEAENALRDELGKVAKKDPTAARKRILELERDHKHRRNWVWCELGESQVAVALGFLAKCAQLTGTALAATSVEEVIVKYAKSGYLADAAAWEAYASVDSLGDIKLVGNVVRAIYLPWLEAAAVTFAKLCERTPLRSLWSPTDVPEVGECILFADGLRFDVAKLLEDELLGQGASVDFQHRVCALPSVTPTAKPAVSPVQDKLSGNGSGADFRPVVTSTGTGLQPASFKQLLSDTGVTPLGFDEFGDPEGRGWTEAGALDRMGHDEGARLARRIHEEVRLLSDRVRSLLDAGWKKVRVVTDHGWLWMPGGLPKTELPHYLAESRWGRCASLKEAASTELQLVPWHWQPSVSIVLPVGVSCFKKGYEYAHGGLSVQECVVPVLAVTSPAGATSAKIEDTKWVGLKCAVKVAGGKGLRADIRTKAADPMSTVLHDKQPKSVDSGNTSMFASDEFEGVAAIIVVVDDAGRVVAKSQTTVGGL